MLKIDNSLLEEVGLAGLPDGEKNSFLKHIYETLEMRVGIRLADQMTNEQLDEFERYFEAKDDAGAFKWLETNFPNYKEIVQEEFDKLKAEITQTAPQILSASQSQAAGVAQPMAIAQPQQPTAAPMSPMQPQAAPTVMPEQPYAQPQPVDQAYQQQEPSMMPPSQQASALDDDTQQSYQQPMTQPFQTNPSPSMTTPPAEPPLPYLQPNPIVQPSQPQQDYQQQAAPPFPDQQPPAGPQQ